MVFRQPDASAVLIAHGSEALCQQLGAVLLSEELWPVRAADGLEARFLLKSLRPVVAVLDVALTDINAFQLIELVKTDPTLRPTKLVLLASVFSKTAYKRRPSSLYGADDYVEQHHIPDMLPTKIGRLLGRDLAGRSPAIKDTMARIQATCERHELSGVARVRTLAQAIVADIALYHEQEILEARDRGITPTLQAALAEGRRVLAELANDDPYPSPDPIADAYDRLLSSMHLRASNER
jgi:CheY-like chemotaxis protein